jgi:hypothetical protein
MKTSYRLLDGPMKGKRIEISAPSCLWAPSRFYVQDNKGEVIGYYSVCVSVVDDFRQAYTWTDVKEFVPSGAR